ncbi:hypothetical protein NDU88_005804 [Pleurodeles waltl]|uniref:Uncharacterized protein n=1 Tax=Pleurodeles waltl TaxID=8319 RepID=A0AAV7PJ34_PLEWA|nr:hypothetical protein NDU88_005804 [Pleurodeles waltl]
MLSGIGRTAGDGGFRGTAACAGREAEKTAGERGIRVTVACGDREAADGNESLETSGKDAPKEDGGPEGTFNYGERRCAKAGHVLGRTCPMQMPT